MRLSNNFILPKLIGHRGVKNLKPENTLESINTAFDLGLECVEVDVKVSQDNIPLLLHDDTLDRTTTGSGLVCNFTFDQINKFDAGYYFYNTKTNIKVPSLRAVLDLIKQKQKYLNIELKPNQNFEKINVENILQTINTISYDKIYFSSFDLSSCIILKETAPYLQCGFLNDDFKKFNIDETIDICKKYSTIYTCSIHSESNFPYEKKQGWMDISLPSGVSDNEYLITLENTLEKIQQHVKPDIVLYDAGVDVFAEDKLGNLKISLEGIRNRDKLVLEHYSKQRIPVATVIGGGYSKNHVELANRHSVIFDTAIKNIAN